MKIRIHSPRPHDAQTVMLNDAFALPWHRQHCCAVRPTATVTQTISVASVNCANSNSYQ